MRWSYQIARIFGIPIRIHLSLILFLGLTVMWGGGLRGLLLMVAIFGSVLLHELGHALVAKSKGLPIADISLYPFGGMARMTMPPKTSGDEIQVAAAGPMVSLVLALGFWAMAMATQTPFLIILAQVNLLLGLFNLVPALPMDGGRILRAFLARRWGYYRATTASARVARWIAAAMAFAGLFWTGWLIVIALFVFFMSMAEEGMARARHFMGDPGYQDTGQGRVFDPFRRFAESSGFRPSGSDWEVFEADSSTTEPEAQKRPHIVIEWQDGRKP